jgi:hypothetical protein
MRCVRLMEPCKGCRKRDYALRKERGTHPVTQLLRRFERRCGGRLRLHHRGRRGFIAFFSTFRVAS